MLSSRTRRVFLDLTVVRRGVRKGVAGAMADEALLLLPLEMPLEDGFLACFCDVFACFCALPAAFLAVPRAVGASSGGGGT